MTLKKQSITTFLLLGLWLYPYTCQAKYHSGNFITSDGCLVVWSYRTTLLGWVKYNVKELKFCNTDGTPLQVWP